MTLTVVWKLIVTYWREAALALLVGLVIGCALQWRNAAFAKGQAVERGRIDDSVVAVLSTQTARIDTLIVHDTVAQTRLVEHVTTLRDTVLQHLTDTLVVKQYIVASDSALHACVETMHDCASFRLSATQEIATLKAQAHPLPITVFRPTVPQSVARFVLGAAVGALADHFITRK